MSEDGNRTTYDAGCRGRDAVPCVHPHVRRATGATSALNEERSTAKTTVCRASGMTTRRVRTSERALLPCGDPVSRSCRDAELRAYKKSRLATRIVRRVSPRPGATRYGDHTRFFCVYECTHGAYVHMAEDSNRTAFDACCRAAEPGAPRVRRTSILTRGALPGRGLKSDRRRRRRCGTPRERRRDGR